MLNRKSDLKKKKKSKIVKNLPQREKKIVCVRVNDPAQLKSHCLLFRRFTVDKNSTDANTIPKTFQPKINEKVCFL